MKPLPTSHLTHTALFHLDSSFLITSISKHAEKLTGSNAAQLINKNVRSLFQEDHRKEHSCNIPQPEDIKDKTIHLRLKLKNTSISNKYKSTFSSWHSLLDKENKPIGYLLEISTNPLKSFQEQHILQNLNIGIIEVNSNFIINSCNKAAEKITGWHARDILTHNTTDIFGDMLGNKRGPLFCTINEGKSNKNIQIKILQQNNIPVLISVSSTAIFNKKHEITGAILTIDNDPENLNNSFILNSMADGVFTVDKNWNITFFNKAAEDITGFQAEDVLGKSCSEIFKSNTCGKNCAIAECLYLGTPVSNRSLIIHDSKNNKLPVSISAAPLTDTDGNIIGGVEVFRDLSIINRQNKAPTHKHYFDNIISKSSTMERFFQIMPDIAASPSNVLITGESGTGKELAALALHNNSDRKDKPFIAVNCGALPETLLESELFGYKEGAFTDARKDKTGRFAAAEEGTLFLDEIGDIPTSVQTKLLRVLQEKTYEPLGSNTPIKANIRIITATNKDLLKAVQNGIFREDLFYRLSVVQMHLPPLRQRKEDIPLLIKHFIDQYSNKQGKDIVGITNTALNILMNFDFPGNIRELQNIIEYAFILCEGSYIKPNDLPQPLAPTHEATNTIDYETRPQTLEEMEKLFIHEALSRNEWKKIATCKEIKVSKDTLRRKIQKYNLEPNKLKKS